MKEIAKASLVYPARNEEVWLGLKQKKVAKGLRSGYGGKQDTEDISILATAKRELDEENDFGIKYRDQDLEPRAIINFTLGYSDKESFSMKVFIYVLNEFTGELGITNEINDPRPFLINDLPFENMLPDNKIFLPKVFNKEYCIGEITSYDGKITENHLENISKEELYGIFKKN